jgi:hypothetical protein
MRLILVALSLVFSFRPDLAEAKGRAPTLQFVYQRLGEPFEKWNCSHQKEPNLPYDYTVDCHLKRRITKYRVHLAVSYYPKTSLGLSAYEILYWVTDISDPARPISDSSTTWIHQDSPNVRPTVFQLSQGVENDAAALQLVIDNRDG